MQQRDRDDRANAATARQRGVDPVVGLGVQAEQGTAAAHGVAREVVADRKAVRFRDLRRAAGGSADKGVAIEQAHRGRGARRQLTCAVRDSLHDRFEVEAHRRELVLHRDHRAQDRDIQRLTPVRGAGPSKRLEGGIHSTLGIDPGRETLNRNGPGLGGGAIGEGDEAVTAPKNCQKSFRNCCFA